MSPRVEHYRDRNNQYRWRVIAANSRIIATSSEGYHNKQDSIDGARLALEALTADLAHAHAHADEQSIQPAK